MPIAESRETLVATHVKSEPISLMRTLFVTLLIISLLILSFVRGEQVETSRATMLLKANNHDVAHFAGLERYREANTKLLPDPRRVVFFGDSLTDNWPLDKFFPSEHYVNRGFSGQTTPQMLVRFQQDVLDLSPMAVVILAGANDIMGKTGPMTTSQTEAYIEAMAELADLHGIHVVLCSMLPVANGRWSLDDMAKITEINTWLKAYTIRHKFIYVDYYDALKDANGNLPAGLSNDGLHPTQAGYAIMTPVASSALQTIPLR